MISSKSVVKVFAHRTRLSVYTLHIMLFLSVFPGQPRRLSFVLSFFATHGRVNYCIFNCEDAITLSNVGGASRVGSVRAGGGSMHSMFTCYAVLFVALLLRSFTKHTRTQEKAASSLRCSRSKGDWRKSWAQRRHLRGRSKCFGRLGVLLEELERKHEIIECIVEELYFSLKFMYRCS